VLGCCGGWPAAGQACSGYLIESDGFRLLIDPGYATLPRLLESTGAELIDAVLISHGHADHCADLHPLLRARALRDDPSPPLPVFTLPEAVDRVLALDRPGILEDAYKLREFAASDKVRDRALSCRYMGTSAFATECRDQAEHSRTDACLHRRHWAKS
jgi:ribonuclease BN (tRNA processing enzyme)